MKKLQQLCAVVILTSVLSLSALAGDMGCPGDVPPPPTSDQTTLTSDQTTLTGDMGCPGVVDTNNTQTSNATVVDPITQAALNLVPSVLSLL